VTGLLLAGIGHITADQKKNFLIVDNSTLSPDCADLETETSTIEKAFDEFTQRKDVAILLINQHVYHI
jgi:V-type H+-transporting ATPase subunit F